MRRGLAWVAGLAAAVALSPPPAAAQDADATDEGVPGASPAWRVGQSPERATWVRPLASALVPGTGQLLAARERGALYLVAEAFFLTRFLARNAEGRRERERYRELALVVARGPFGALVADTTFEYYEQMAKFVESGPFDTDPGPLVQPPTDERTYNGQIWALARRTFFVDPDAPPPPDSPEYERALAFYRERAIGPNFEWSWRNAGLEQDLFRQTIRQSDEAFRQASQELGLLLANHVLSAVDAFISERLSRSGRDVTVTSGMRVLPGWGRGLDFAASVRIAF